VFSTTQQPGTDDYSPPRNRELSILDAEVPAVHQHHRACVEECPDCPCSKLFGAIVHKNCLKRKNSTTCFRETILTA
jgi:hypothetical protein